ncbi:hypothetical protein [Bosea sp. CS1GBMeth4]|uniref:hypothetical protein n=1 Tax=Bosea sp. CS1GBMeth4 TaxID=1892849 RepID=UPI0016456396|nr:hypothetical protein [Bosea sp. CS1GBMeth4]
MTSNLVLLTASLAYDSQNATLIICNDTSFGSAGGTSDDVLRVVGERSHILKGRLELRF